MAAHSNQFIRIYAENIVRHEGEPFAGTIIIDLGSGLITQVAKGRLPGPYDYEYGTEYLVFAGFSDIHIHAREDQTGNQSYKEDYDTARDAAQNGGVVLVCAMPNTFIPVRGGQQLGWHRRRVDDGHPVVVLNYIGVDSETAPMGRTGEYPYKCYFGKSVGSLTILLGSDLERTLAQYENEEMSFHVEYEPVVLMSASGRTHSDRRPIAAVNEGLRLLLPLIKKYKIKAKLCHWSTGGESFALIQEYRDQGCDITLEVSPLHLFFHTGMTDADPSLWLKVQMNPAIQGPEHCEALIEGLRTRFIQYLATDHAPHTKKEKHSAFAKFADRYPGKSNVEIAEALRKEDFELYLQTCCENNHSGAPWLDTYAAACILLMAEHGFTPQDIARVASFNPGAFANKFLAAQWPGRNFSHGFGDIAEGYMGSLTILDMSKPMTIERNYLKTKVGWSPFEGRTIPGSVAAMFMAGQKY